MAEEKKVLSRVDLVKRVAVATEVEEKIVTKVVGALETEIVGAIKDGAEIRMVGFGTFAPKFNQARKGRNPQTGDEIDIASSHNLKFKPSKKVKEELNK